MNDKFFVLLGGNILCKGIYDKLKYFGYTVIVVDWNVSPSVKGDIHLQLDVKESKSVVDALVNGEYDIDGAITCIDLAVPTVNAINKTFGLKIMPTQFNSVLTKKEMRDEWIKSDIFNRFSKTISEITVDDILKINEKLSLIIKPNIAASLRGITIVPRNSSLELLNIAIDKALKLSFDNDCLVEEYVEGQEFTVDMLGDDYDNVCVYGISVKYHSLNAINNRVSVKIHWNSNIYTDEIYKKIAAIGKMCYKSLGLKNSFGHLEVIMKSDGTITPLEIGARSSGFIASHLVSAASGKDYLEDYIKMLHGYNIGSNDFINGLNSAMWYGYDIPVGLHSFRKNSLTDYLPKEIEVMYSNSAGIVAGKTYEPIIDDNGRDNLGYEMIKGPKNILTIDNILKWESKFIKDLITEL